jgi:hypothetical protein
MFSKIRDKAAKTEKEKVKEDQARLEVFLSAVAELEEEHHCEIQARVRVTPSAIVAIPQAVVLPIPQPTNDQPTATGERPGAEAASSKETPQATTQA